MYNERSDYHCVSQWDKRLTLCVSHSGNMSIPCHALKSQLKRSVNETTKLFLTKLHLKHWLSSNVNNDVSFIWVILHMSILFGCLRGVNTDFASIVFSGSVTWEQSIWYPLWVLTFPLEDCSEFGNFVITLIY